MNKCSSDSLEFLNSVSNNTSLISFFWNIMKCEDFETPFCDNYIGTKTVKKALYNDGESVEAVACDSEILCLLLHYMTLLDIGKNSFMNSMKLIKSFEQHVARTIQDVVEKK